MLNFRGISRIPPIADGVDGILIDIQKVLPVSGFLQPAGQSVPTYLLQIDQQNPEIDVLIHGGMGNVIESEGDPIVCVFHIYNRDVRPAVMVRQFAQQTTVLRREISGSQDVDADVLLSA